MTNPGYGPDFYNALRDEDWPHQQRAILGVCALFGIPPSYCDVGCGSGATVDVMAHLMGNKRVLGYERREFFPWMESLVPADRPQGAFEPIDLEHDLILPSLTPWDLVTSWEVGEHLAPGSAGLYAQTLANLTKAGGRLVFTAAHPDQPGFGHVNCQPKEFWVNLLFDNGFEYERDMTGWMWTIWDNTVNPLLHLRDNVLVFTKLPVEAPRPVAEPELQEPLQPIEDPQPIEAI